MSHGQAASSGEVLRCPFVPADAHPRKTRRPGNGPAPSVACAGKGHRPGALGAALSPGPWPCCPAVSLRALPASEERWEPSATCPWRCPGTEPGSMQPALHEHSLVGPRNDLNSYKQSVGERDGVPKTSSATLGTRLRVGCWVPPAFRRASEPHACRKPLPAAATRPPSPRGRGRQP